MTTQLVDAPLVDVPEAKPAAAPAQRRPRWPGWLREPLLHFVLIGGLLFAIDHVLVGDSEDLNLIVVGAEVNSHAIHTFEASRGRKPNHEELEALHRVWLDNEVLYREGLALGMDRGDEAIRERVIFKALSMVGSNVKLPLPDDKTLRAWFESKRHKYDEPPRYDFEEAALSGKSSEAAVREFVGQLNGGTPGDAKAGLRVFKGRPHANLVQSYGQEFADTLAKLERGVWHALETRDGWRAMRLTALSEPKPAAYESVRGMVLQDYKDAIGAEQRTAAVRTLAKKYQIEFEDGHVCEADK